MRSRLIGIAYCLPVLILLGVAVSGSTLHALCRCGRLWFPAVIVLTRKVRWVASSQSSKHRMAWHGMAGDILKEVAVPRMLTTISSTQHRNQEI